MKFTTSLAILLLSGNMSYASSLAVYQDNTFYTFTPKNNFLGFSKGLKARCGGSTLPMEITTSCPSDDRLCQVMTDLKNVEQKLQAVQHNSKFLKQLASLPQPTTVDATFLIESAKELGNAQARLLEEEKGLRQEAEMKESAFDKQAPSRHAIKSVKRCDQELDLTLPYGYVSFSTAYEADIEDEKEVEVTQYLSITNRSGIDIEADSAMFYYRDAHQTVYPTHFYPWVVRKYEPMPLVAKRAKGKREQMDMLMMAEQRAAPSVSYEDAREYKIDKLVLPSTGVPLEIKVVRWKAPLSCEIRAYPYTNTQAFHVCSFEPKYQIEHNQWKVNSSQELINEKAQGEYREGRYDIYTKVEEDINIVRKPIVNKERETGIFGGTVRKKDGYRISITNKSDKVKTLTLIERIPTSTTEEITSKLLSINSKKKVDYNILKEGQIEIKLTLAPHEMKKIEVLFELSYDKDLKVKY
ncbi:DUF4139 domain-containing protein [Sulfurovum sp. XTW-4]|uniref:DUF4139 domain-containing protein n=1 Tax=Sulfurovum xiamenensis TaxID=3019066 RepID=A0ABT7QU28_9BACT|nr:DUF4139 domain-containing protein [Sulfurovum xiamenensis]MDM5264587.1 DUF4139 domain-containing protein [Sulfurovum xiamenensis]